MQLHRRNGGAHQGTAPVVNAFWVDAYVNPDPVPGRVNQTWNKVAQEGLVWAVYGEMLPIKVGGTLTLTLESAGYWPERSYVAWPTTPGDGSRRTPTTSDWPTREPTATWGVRTPWASTITSHDWTRNAG